MSKRAAANKLAQWSADPVHFVREAFQAEPDDWQRDFLLGYHNGKRTAAKACKGPGKTAVLAWCGWHYLVTRRHPKIVATSITWDNLRDNLWAEMAKWQQKSEFLQEAFTWRAERIVCNDHPETWFMSARAWPKDADATQQANALAGIHADNVMFILDEVGGIPDAVMATAEAALANAGSEANPQAEAKLLIAGNPTHLSGPLYRACTAEASLWRVIEITGDPDDPKRSKRISIDWAREQIAKYGRDNPWVLVNVFGKFPPASINALLGPEEVQAAMTRILRPEVWNRAVKVLGVDVALQGDDRTVIAPRQGLVCFKPKIMRSPDPKEIAGTIAVAIKKFEPDGVFIDNSGGWGSGVISWLREWGYSVTDVQFGGKPLSNVYYNKRTEMHYELALYVKNGACLPNIPELKEELCAQTYTHKGDRLLMTQKEQIKELLGRSPDIADAFALTFAFPVGKKDPLDALRVPQTSGDYDPIKKAFDEPQQKNDDYNPLVG